MYRVPAAGFHPFRSAAPTQGFSQQSQSHIATFVPAQPSGPWKPPQFPSQPNPLQPLLVEPPQGPNRGYPAFQQSQKWTPSQPMQPSLEHTRLSEISSETMNTLQSQTPVRPPQPQQTHSKPQITQSDGPVPQLMRYKKEAFSRKPAFKARSHGHIYPGAVVSNPTADAIHYAKGCEEKLLFPGKTVIRLLHEAAKKFNNPEDVVDGICLRLQATQGNQQQNLATWFLLDSLLKGGGEGFKSIFERRLFDIARQFMNRDDPNWDQFQRMTERWKEYLSPRTLEQLQTMLQGNKDPIPLVKLMDIDLESDPPRQLVSAKELIDTCRDGNGTREHLVRAQIMIESVSLIITRETVPITFLLLDTAIACGDYTFARKAVLDFALEEYFDFDTLRLLKSPTEYSIPDWIDEHTIKPEG